MAIVVEFTIPSDAFPFGRAISGDPNIHITLEEVVPFGEGRIPFIWVKSSDEDRLESFEKRVTENELTETIERIAQIEGNTLYRVDWHGEKETFLKSIGDFGGTIMRGHVNEACSFTVRFETHADLTNFHQFYQDEDFPVHIDRVYEFGEGPDEDARFDLTPMQRKALVMAVENGYFAVPRETTLEDIADELDVTRQATSELVRRGAEKVLQAVLLGPSTLQLDVENEE